MGIKKYQFSDLCGFVSQISLKTWILNPLSRQHVYPDAIKMSIQMQQPNQGYLAQKHLLFLKPILIFKRN